MPKGKPPIILTCSYCQTSFQRYYSDYLRETSRGYNNTYCSRKCQHNGRSYGNWTQYEPIFWSRVVKLDSGCWSIRSIKKPNTLTNRITLSGNGESSYRLAFYYQNERLPPRSKVVMHLCDNRLCCNPSHLGEGTQRNNSEDRDLKNRTAKGEAVASHKLKEYEIPKIRELYRCGLSQRKLSLLFNVSRVSIKRIVQYEQWKHIA